MARKLYIPLKCFIKLTAIYVDHIAVGCLIGFNILTIYTGATLILVSINFESSSCPGLRHSAIKMHPYLLPLKRADCLITGTAIIFHG